MSEKIIGVDQGRPGGDYTAYVCSCGDIRIETDGPCKRKNCPIPVSTLQPNTLPKDGLPCWSLGLEAKIARENRFGETDHQDAASRHAISEAAASTTLNTAADIYRNIRNKALEEAAQACEREQRCWIEENTQLACMGCADEIRALKVSE